MAILTKEFEQSANLPDIASYEERLDYNFPVEIKNSFRRILPNRVDNRQFVDLQEYGKTIPEKLKTLEQPVGLPDSLANFYLESIKEDDFEPEYFSMISKVRHNTGYFRELEEVGIAEAVLDEIQNGQYGAYVRFLDSEKGVGRYISLDGRVGGAYVPGLDSVLILQRPPSRKDIWLSMATDGTLPLSISLLDHELTHDAQWQKFQRISNWLTTSTKWAGYNFVNNRFGFGHGIAYLLTIGRLIDYIGKIPNNDQSLGEVHAYAAQAAEPFYSKPDLDDKNEIMNHVINGYRLGKDKEVRVDRSYDLVTVLRLLGLDDKEIGQEVSMAKFDENAETYPKLESRLSVERRNWGLEENDQLFEDTIYALLAKQQLEKKVQRHMATDIAVKSLKRSAGLII